jgi:hypothetical protein
MNIEGAIAPSFLKAGQKMFARYNKGEESS